MEMRVIRKQRFFEKKRAKNFCSWGRLERECRQSPPLVAIDGTPVPNAPRSKSFFGSFFSKKELLSY
jgi:hypothetical protein